MSTYPSSHGRHRDFWRLSLPVIFIMASRTLMTLVDVAVIGRLGTQELAAVGMASMVMWSGFAFFQGLLLSLTTFISRRHGQGDADGVAIHVWQGFYLAFLASLALIPVLFWVESLFSLLGASYQTTSIGSCYARIRFYGAPALFIHIVVSSFLRGTRNPGPATWIEAIANIIHLPLSCIWTLGLYGLPRWGLMGAASATIATEYLAAFAYLLIFFMSKQRSSMQARGIFRPNPAILLQIVRIGAPMGCRILAGLGSSTIFCGLIAQSGSIALAAHTAAISLLTISGLPIRGFAFAAMTFVGQHLGESRPDLSRRAGWTAIQWTTAYGLFVALNFLLFSRQWVACFSNDPEVIEFGGYLLMIVAAFQLFDGLLTCIAGILEGAGDTWFAMLYEVLFCWLLFLPCSYLVAVHWHQGALSAWGVATFSTVLTVATYLFRFMGSRWEQVQV